MTTVHVVATVLVGVVFLVAGAAKLVDRPRWRTEARDLGAPVVVVPVVPYAEIAVGAALVAQIAPTLFAIAALAMLAVFTVLVARVLASGRRPVCACFGAWSSRPIGAATVARNVLLMLVCVVALV